MTPVSAEMTRRRDATIHTTGNRIGLALVDTVLLFGHATGAVLTGLASAVRLTLTCIARVLPG